MSAIGTNRTNPHARLPLLDNSGQRWISARNGLSANDPKRTFGRGMFDALVAKANRHVGRPANKTSADDAMMRQTVARQGDARITSRLRPERTAQHLARWPRLRRQTDCREITNRRQAKLCRREIPSQVKSPASPMIAIRAASATKKFFKNKKLQWGGTFFVGRKKWKTAGVEGK